MKIMWLVCFTILVVVMWLWTRPVETRPCVTSYGPGPCYGDGYWVDTEQVRHDVP